MKKLRLLLRARELGAVRVGTVDDFQGQEARIIFISTVLSRPSSDPLGVGLNPRGATPNAPSAAADPAVGFFRNPNRFNVAITRAQALMVVLGHPQVLMQVETSAFAFSLRVPGASLVSSCCPTRKRCCQWFMPSGGQSVQGRTVSHVIVSSYLLGLMLQSIKHFQGHSEIFASGHTDDH